MALYAEVDHLLLMQPMQIKTSATLKASFELQKEGELKPGAKGLALSQEQWKTLVDNIADISQAVEAGNTGFSIDLGNKRLASVSSYKNKLQVDLRSV